LFLRDAHMETDSDFHLRYNTVVPRADAIADCTRLLIDAFDDLLLALAGWFHLDWVTLGCSPTLTFCDNLAGSLENDRSVYFVGARTLARLISWELTHRRRTQIISPTVGGGGPGASIPVVYCFS
jgi:hypothetical protein